MLNSVTAASFKGVNYNSFLCYNRVVLCVSVLALNVFCWLDGVGGLFAYEVVLDCPGIVSLGLKRVNWILCGNNVVDVGRVLIKTFKSFKDTLLQMFHFPLDGHLK